MADAYAHARSPLAGRARELAAVGAAEVAFLAQVDLRADPALASRLPFALPLEPNVWTAGGGREALWLGPDEWLVVGGPGSASAITAELGRALAPGLRPRPAPARLAPRKLRADAAGPRARAPPGTRPGHPGVRPRLVRRPPGRLVHIGGMTAGWSRR